MAYQWCHGPECHKRHTSTRVRGVKGFKVLRTIKFAVNNYRANSIYKYFCDQTCMHNFIHKHIEEFVQLHPRTEPLETPIDIQVETGTDYFGRPYKKKVIVDRPTEDVVG